MTVTHLFDGCGPTGGWDSLLAQLTVAQGLGAGACLLVDGVGFLCSCTPDLDWGGGGWGLGLVWPLLCAAKSWALIEGEFQNGICQ